MGAGVIEKPGGMIKTAAALNSVENPPDPASLGAVLIHLTARLTLFPYRYLAARGALLT